MSGARRLLLSLAMTLVCLWLAAAPGAAQTRSSGLDHDHGAWFMLFGHGSFERLSPQLRSLRWWFDGQVRLLGASGGYDQALVRPGVGWAFTEGLSAWLGYAYVNTEPGDRASFDEHRIWQQLLWSTRLEPVGFQSRTRLEQRFLETGSDTGWRLRQFFKLTYPLPPWPRFGLAGYDELFFDLNDTDWGANAGFAQNRLFVGPFWRLDSKGRATFEIGYLNQLLANAGRSDRMNHVVSVNLLLSLR